MPSITAAECHDRLDDLLDIVEDQRAASVSIERNGRPVAMLLEAKTAEKLILGAYAQGVLARSAAMQLLGLSWYGDLLQRMNARGIARPSASAEEAAAMQQAMDDVLGPMQSIEPLQHS